MKKLTTAGKKKLVIAALDDIKAHDIQAIDVHKLTSICDWILVDAGDVIAHVMQPAVRSYYNLEELWGDGRFDKVVNSSAPVRAKKRRAGTRPRKAR